MLGVEITNGWRITGGRSINGAKIIDFIDQKHPRRKKKTSQEQRENRLISETKERKIPTDDTPRTGKKK